MYWLGFFVTLVILLVSSMLYHKVAEIKYEQGNFPVYCLAVVFIVVLAAIWPVTWAALIVCGVSYVLYKWLLKLINKRLKGKEPDV